jgi:TolB-like protein/tetratricopeptide (TPR) repeat protein
METGFRVGSWQIEPSLNTVSRNGASVHLEPKVFQVLMCLAEHAGEPVTKEELFRVVWPNTFVSDDVLKHSISELRQAFDDDSREPRVIQTIPKHGYRLVAAVERPKVGRIESLAVLPLDNLSRDPEQDYFADGLTEALITNLAKIGALRVVSRTTAMQYKSVRNKSVREIARELGVDGIVEGTVLRSGERVRISAKLIRATTDTHLWAESYDRDLRDVLALQADVTQAIVREIQVRITPQEQAKVAQVRPVDPEAYEAYLKGRHHWNKRNGPGIKKGAEYFQRAIEKDPTYAAAYAGLADSAGIAGFWGFVCPEEGCRTAKVAARKALEIEETGEAHASLGWAVLHHDFDYLGAEREFQRAIQLNPRYATAHQWYGQCLAYMGRFDEAQVETTRALQLDPLSLIIHTSHAATFWVARKWDRAIDHCLKASELDPNSVPLSCLLGHVYQGKGMYDEAIGERQRTIELAEGAPLFVADLGSSYAVAGKREEAIQILKRLHEFSKHRYVSAHSFALIHVGLKETDEAFQWLEKAYQERSAILAWAKVDPRLDNLRADRRFQDLLHRMNCPP